MWNQVDFSRKFHILFMCSQPYLCIQTSQHFYNLVSEECGLYSNEFCIYWKSRYSIWSSVCIMNEGDIRYFWLPLQIWGLQFALYRLFWVSSTVAQIGQYSLNKSDNFKIKTTLLWNQCINPHTELLGCFVNFNKNRIHWAQDKQKELKFRYFAWYAVSVTLLVRLTATNHCLTD
jgi:hypothetical protein